jgi:hypothetical protein
MLKLEPVPVENANDESKEALQSIAEKNGFVSNIFGTFAHAPAAPPTPASALRGL